MQKKISSALLLTALVIIGTACADKHSRSEADFGLQSYTDAAPPTTEASEAPVQGYEDEAMSRLDTSPVTYKDATQSANGNARKKSVHSDFISSSAAEIGEPRAVDSGAAAMKKAVTPARWRAGNQ